MVALIRIHFFLTMRDPTVAAILVDDFLPAIVDAANSCAVRLNPSSDATMKVWHHGSAFKLISSLLSYSQTTTSLCIFNLSIPKLVAIFRLDSSLSQLSKFPPTEFFQVVMHLDCSSNSVPLSTEWLAAFIDQILSLPTDSKGTQGRQDDFQLESKQLESSLQALLNICTLPRVVNTIESLPTIRYLYTWVWSLLKSAIFKAPTNVLLCRCAMDMISIFLKSSSRKNKCELLVNQSSNIFIIDKLRIFPAWPEGMRTSIDGFYEALSMVYNDRQIMSQLYKLELEKHMQICRRDIRTSRLEEAQTLARKIDWTKIQHGDTLQTLSFISQRAAEDSDVAVGLVLTELLLKLCRAINGFQRLSFSDGIFIFEPFLTIATYGWCHLADLQLQG